MPEPPDDTPGDPTPRPATTVRAPDGTEEAALRRSLERSSQRVRELGVALANARELLELRAGQEAEHAARLEEATEEIIRLRRRVMTLRHRLARREKALRQAAKRDTRLEALERSPAYRAARRGASWPVVGGMLRRALPTRRA